MVDETEMLSVEQCQLLMDCSVSMELVRYGGDDHQQWKGYVYTATGLGLWSYPIVASEERMVWLMIDEHLRPRLPEMRGFWGMQWKERYEEEVGLVKGTPWQMVHDALLEAERDFEARRINCYFNGGS